MNFILKDEWKKLSDLLGTDYDSSVKYRVHTNDSLYGTLLCYTTELNPAPEDLKSVAALFSDIYFEEGEDPSLRANLRGGSISIDITEVA